MPGEQHQQETHSIESMLNQRRMQLVSAVREGGMFDASVIRDFDSSRQPDGNYLISPSDPIVLKNAKALINLLVDIEQLTHTLFRPYAQRIQAETTMSAVFHTLNTGVSAGMDLAQIKRFVQSIAGMQVYLKQLKDVFADLPYVDSTFIPFIEHFKTIMAESIEPTINKVKSYTSTPELQIAYHSLQEVLSPRASSAPEQRSSKLVAVMDVLAKIKSKADAIIQHRSTVTTDESTGLYTQVSDNTQINNLMKAANAIVNFRHALLNVDGIVSRRSYQIRDTFKDIGLAIKELAEIDLESIQRLGAQEFNDAVKLGLEKIQPLLIELARQVDALESRLGVRDEALQQLFETTYASYAKLATTVGVTLTKRPPFWEDRLPVRQSDLLKKQEQLAELKAIRAGVADNQIKPDTPLHVVLRLKLGVSKVGAPQNLLYLKLLNRFIEARTGMKELKADIAGLENRVLEAALAKNKTQAAVAELNSDITALRDNNGFLQACLASLKSVPKIALSREQVAILPTLLGISRAQFEAHQENNTLTRIIEEKQGNNTRILQRKIQRKNNGERSLAENEREIISMHAEINKLYALRSALQAKIESAAAADQPQNFAYQRSSGGVDARIGDTCLVVALPGELNPSLQATTLLAIDGVIDGVSHDCMRLANRVAVAEEEVVKQLQKNPSLSDETVRLTADLTELVEKIGGLEVSSLYSRPLSDIHELLVAVNLLGNAQTAPFEAVLKRVLEERSGLMVLQSEHEALVTRLEAKTAEVAEQKSVNIAKIEQIRGDVIGLEKQIEILATATRDSTATIEAADQAIASNRVKITGINEFKAAVMLDYNRVHSADAIRDIAAHLNISVQDVRSDLERGRGYGGIWYAMGSVHPLVKRMNDRVKELEADNKSLQANIDVVRGKLAQKDAHVIERDGLLGQASSLRAHNGRLDESVAALAQSRDDKVVEIQALRSQIVRGENLDAIASQPFYSGALSEDFPTLKLAAMRVVRERMIKELGGRDPPLTPPLVPVTPPAPRAEVLVEGPDALAERLLNANTGPICLGLQQARAKILASLSEEYINPTELAKLSEAKREDGTYSIAPTDSILIKNIKTILNTLVQIEALVTTMQEQLNNLMNRSSGLGTYVGLVVTAPGKINAEVRAIQESLTSLQFYLNQMSDSAQKLPVTSLGEIPILAKMRDLVAPSLSSYREWLKMPGLAEILQVDFTGSINTALSFLDSVSKAPVVVPVDQPLSFRPLTLLANKVDAFVSANWSGPDGEENSDAKNLRKFARLLREARGALLGAVAAGGGDTTTGSFKALWNLFNIYKKISNIDLSRFADLKEIMRETVSLMHPLLIKAALKSEQLEREFGLTDGFTSGIVKKVCVQFEEVASSKLKIALPTRYPYLREKIQEYKSMLESQSSQLAGLERLRSQMSAGSLEAKNLELYSLSELVTLRIEIKKLHPVLVEGMIAHINKIIANKTGISVLELEIKVVRESIINAERVLRQATNTLAQLQQTKDLVERSQGVLAQVVQDMKDDKALTDVQINSLHPLISSLTETQFSSLMAANQNVFLLMQQQKMAHLSGDNAFLLACKDKISNSTMNSADIARLKGMLNLSDSEFNKIILQKKLGKLDDKIAKNTQDITFLNSMLQLRAAPSSRQVTQLHQLLMPLALQQFVQLVNQNKSLVESWAVAKNTDVARQLSEASSAVANQERVVNRQQSDIDASQQIIRVKKELHEKLAGRVDAINDPGVTVKEFKYDGAAPQPIVDGSCYTSSHVSISATSYENFMQAVGDQEAMLRGRHLALAERVAVLQDEQRVLRQNEIQDMSVAQRLASLDGEIKSNSGLFEKIEKDRGLASGVLTSLVSPVISALSVEVTTALSRLRAEDAKQQEAQRGLGQLHAKIEEMKLNSLTRVPLDELRKFREEIVKLLENKAEGYVGLIDRVIAERTGLVDLRQSVQELKQTVFGNTETISIQQVDEKVAELKSNNVKLEQYRQNIAAGEFSWAKDITSLTTFAGLLGVEIGVAKQWVSQEQNRQVAIFQGKMNRGDLAWSEADIALFAKVSEKSVSDVQAELERARVSYESRSYLSGAFQYAVSAVSAVGSVLTTELSQRIAEKITSVTQQTEQCVRLQAEMRYLVRLEAHVSDPRSDLRTSPADRPRSVAYPKADPLPVSETQWKAESAKVQRVISGRRVTHLSAQN